MLAEAGAIEVVGKMEKMGVRGGRRRAKHRCNFKLLLEAVELRFLLENLVR